MRSVQKPNASVIAVQDDRRLTTELLTLLSSYQAALAEAKSEIAALEARVTALEP